MVIEIENLTKEYGNIKALDNVSLKLTEGIYGLLGPNGAGKSTLINLLTDNTKRTSGKILCDGIDILKMGAAYRTMIGYMPQQQTLYPDFTLERFLLYIASAKDIPAKAAVVQVSEMIEKVNLN